MFQKWQMSEFQSNLEQFLQLQFLLNWKFFSLRSEQSDTIPTSIQWTRIHLFLIEFVENPVGGFFILNHADKNKTIRILFALVQITLHSVSYVHRWWSCIVYRIRKLTWNLWFHFNNTMCQWRDRTSSPGSFPSHRRHENSVSQNSWSLCPCVSNLLKMSSDYFFAHYGTVWATEVFNSTFFNILQDVINFYLSKVSKGVDAVFSTKQEQGRAILPNFPKISWNLEFVVGRGGAHLDPPMM